MPLNPNNGNTIQRITAGNRSEVSDITAEITGNNILIYKKDGMNHYSSTKCYITLSVNPKSNETGI